MTKAVYIVLVGLIRDDQTTSFKFAVWHSGTALQYRSDREHVYFDRTKITRCAYDSTMFATLVAVNARSISGILTGCEDHPHELVVSLCSVIRRIPRSPISGISSLIMKLVSGLVLLALALGSNAQGTVAEWGQCAGIGYTGSTSTSAGYDVH